MVEVLSFLQIGWLNAIREWQEEFVGNMSSREFVETITRDLLGSCVFVFTPRGEVRLRINLHL
jgi:(p)ppGpp synthase/HD superfamily hydrolase